MVTLGRRWRTVAVVAAIVLGSCGGDDRSVLSGEGWRLTVSRVAQPGACVVLHVRGASSQACGLTGNVMVNRLGGWAFGVAPAGTASVLVDGTPAAVAPLSGAGVTVFVGRGEGNRVVARDDAGKVIAVGAVDLPPAPDPPPG
jgi:hypothetical protein